MAEFNHAAMSALTRFEKKLKGIRITNDHLTHRKNSLSTI